MTKIALKFCVFFMLLCSAAMYSQNVLNLNKGTADKKQYYVTLPYKEVKSMVIIQCSISGRPYSFIVDTGAAMSITPKLFKELQPSVLTNMPVSDQAGMLDSLQIVSLNNIKLGDVTFNGVSTMVVKDTGVFDCLGVDGVIGSNLLRNSIIQFSSTAHTVTITNDTKKLSLKRKYASAMELDAVQSNPFIWIKATNGKVVGRDNVLFDSGMDGFYDLKIESFQKIPASYNLFTVLAKAKGTFTWGVHGLPSAQDYYKVSSPQIIINGVAFSNVISETTYGASSRIGNELFKYGVVTLDYKHKKFYFEPFDKISFDLHVDEWPFSPSIKDDKFVIGIVWGERWREIIVPNDEILEFDGKVYKGANICELMISNRKSSHTTAKLILKDAITGEIKEIEISKE